MLIVSFSACIYSLGFVFNQRMIEDQVINEFFNQRNITSVYFVLVVVDSRLIQDYMSSFIFSHMFLLILQKRLFINFGTAVVY